MQSNLSSSTSLMRLHSIYTHLHQHRDTPFYLRKKRGVGNGFSPVLCLMLLNPNSILTASFVFGVFLFICLWVFVVCFVLFVCVFPVWKLYLLSKELELGRQIKN